MCTDKDRDSEPQLLDRSNIRICAEPIGMSWQTVASETKCLISPVAR